jgi:effector-binding domain-containing protein
MIMKSILRLLGIILLALGIWYFFVKGYNYRISFTTNQSQGIVYDHLIRWNDGKSYRDTIVINLKKEPFSNITQNYKFGDSLFKFNWNLKMIDENTTKVTVNTKDEYNSFIQNILILSTQNHFKKKSIATVKKFGKSLLRNKENYNLHSVRDSIIPSQYCIYVSVESKASNKAQAMLKNIFYTMNYIKAYDEIQLTGQPFLEVTEWNIEKDSLKFDFCFPIKKLKEYPPMPSKVKIKETKERKALKTIFNGNYKISDRAWIQLRDYARYHDIEVTNLPVEIYYNDPHNDVNPMDWVAEVFMPIE